MSVSQTKSHAERTSTFCSSRGFLYATEYKHGTEVFAFTGTGEFRSLGYLYELDDGFTLKDSSESVFFFKCFEDSTNIWELSGPTSPRLVAAHDECILPQESGLLLGNTLCILDWAGVLLYRIETR
jgi:hypothetical protein